MKIEDINLEHLSASSINSFLRCPAVWYFRYIEGLKQPPTAPMTLGKSVDKSLDTNYKHKIQTKTDLNVAEVLDVFSTTFDESKEETDFQDDKPGDVKDTGVRIITKYHTEVSPKLQPLESQRKISIDLPESPLPIIGYIDLIDDKLLVRDNKVKAYAPSKNPKGEPQPTHDEIVQLTIYEHGLLSEGITPSGLQIDTITSGRTPQIWNIPVQSSMTDLVYIQNCIKKIMKCIQHEIFMPNRNSFICTQRHCGFWRNCEKLYGGRVKE